MPDEYGWFTLPDLDLLYSAISKLPDPSTVILVGGQSVSFWVDYFDINLPVQETAYLTQDADFLGTHRDAELLAKSLGAKIKKATIDDNTPNLAVLTFRGAEGKPLLIDFLSIIIGVDEKAIRARAIPIQWNDKELHILHPMLCLKSRLENLKTLPGKRDRNGISQARVAVEIIRKYIVSLLSSAPEREAINAAKQLRKMAISDAGVYVFKHYQIDILAAIDPTMFKTDLFRERDWPNALRWAKKRRDIALAK